MKNNYINTSFLTISYAELWNRINYYGLLSVMILFLTKQLGITDTESYVIYGIATSLSFGFSILGGFLADRILGFYYTSILGSLLIGIGTTFLTIQNLHFFYLALSISLVGFGFLKPCTPNLIGTITKDSAQERGKIFSMFYLFLNIGSISGPILYGVFIHNNNYWLAFFFGALGMLSVIALLIYSKKLLQFEEHARTIKYNQAMFITILSIGISFLLFYYQNIFPGFLIAVLIISIFITRKSIKNLSLQEKRSIVMLTVPIATSVIFIAAMLQIYSSITLFIDRYVGINFLNWKIPTAWYSSIEPIILIAIVPVLNYFVSKLKNKNTYNTQQNQTIFGLLITAIAFVFFALIAYFTLNKDYLSFVLLLLGYGFLAVGELCTIPVTMSLTNLLAPKTYQGTLMGFFYFSMMLSGYLAGFIAKWAPPSNAAPAKFGTFFMVLFIILLISSALLFLLNTFIKKRLTENSTSTAHGIGNTPKND